MLEKLKKIRFLHKWHSKGYFSAKVRSQRFINFIFQRILRMNSECRFSVHYTSKIIAPEKIVMGRGVEQRFLFSGNCYIQALNGIFIGAGTLFGPGVKIISANHDIRDYSKPVRCRPIRIGKDCWIGANAILLPGIELGDRTIIGAGTVVSKSLKKGNVMAISSREMLYEEISSR